MKRRREMTVLIINPCFLRFLSDLVPECASSEEAFLLVVAAISNLTFLEVSSIDLLRRYNTMAYVINLVGNRGTDYSVFVLDHVRFTRDLMGLIQP